MSSNRTGGKTKKAKTAKPHLNSPEPLPDSNSDEGSAEVEDKKMRRVQTPESVHVLLEAVKECKPFNAIQGRNTKKMEDVIEKLSKHRSKLYPNGISASSKTIGIFGIFRCNFPFNSIPAC